MDELKDEYLAVSKKETTYLVIGVIVSSLVFVVPFLIIMLKGWWQPLGTANDGWRWVKTSAVLLLLIYAALAFDIRYRKH